MEIMYAACVTEVKEKLEHTPFETIKTLSLKDNKL